MKKLLSFLLVISMLFALSACNKSENSSNDNNIENNAEINSIYVGEWKANVITSFFNGVYTYDVTTFTLNADGTCLYKGYSGTWKYNEDSNQISLILDLDKTGVGSSLEITNKDGKDILVKKDSDDQFTCYYYRSEEFVPKTNDDQPIIDDNPPTNTTGQSLSKEIKITLDNWQEYFEVIEYPYWQENAFGEIDDLTVWWGIQIKEKYHALIDIEKEQSVAFELSGKYSYYGIQVDTSKQEYTYTGSIWADSEEIVKDTTTYDLLGLYNYDTKDFVFLRVWSSGIGKAADIYGDGKMIETIYRYYDISVLRAEGKIFLLEQ